MKQGGGVDRQKYSIFRMKNTKTIGKKERGEQERRRRIYIQIYCGREEERELRRDEEQVQRDMQVCRHNSMHYLVEEKHLTIFRQTFSIGLVLHS